MADVAQKPHPDVVFTRFDETSAALLHLRTKRYYTLNETAARVWELLGEGRDRTEIATIVGAEFDVGLDEATSCVEDVLTDFASEGLVAE